MNKATRALRAADALQQRYTWLALPVAVGKKFADDQAARLAGLIAFHAFLAVFPLLLVLVTVLDRVLQHDQALRQRLLNSALAQYPVIGPQLAHNIGPLHQTGLALVTGLLVVLFGARGLAIAAQNALNSVWEIPIARRPSFPWSWVRGFGMILVPGLGLIGTTTLSILASGSGRIMTGFGVHAAAFAGSMVLNIGVFWLAFRLATASEISWRQLRLGAIIGALIWQVLQGIGGYLVAHQLAHASPEYGTFAVVLGLIFWLYLEAELTLYAVEANVVRAYRLWPRSIAPPPYTEQDLRAYQLYVQVEQRRKDVEIVVGIGGEDDRETTPG
jgi:membrane protein